MAAFLFKQTKYFASFIVVFLVLDASAFERLLGPCMDIMKRNKDTYQEMLVKAFGSKVIDN